MDKLFFLPERFSAPFSTVLISELRIAWITKHLDGSWWLTSSAAEFGGAAYERVQRAMAGADDHMQRDLMEGTLVAHIYVETFGEFRKIPAAYWKEESSVISLYGSLFELSNGQIFVKELRESKVFVRGDYASLWLKQQGIFDTDPSFPASLRSTISSPSPIRRKTKYHWPQFHDEAVDQLHENGAFAGDWNQARLEEHMLKWCNGNWEREPSPRMVRDHVRASVLKFLQEKEDTLGS